MNLFVYNDLPKRLSFQLSDEKLEKNLSLCVLPTSDYLELRKYAKGEELLIQGKICTFWEKGSQMVIKESKVLDKKQIYFRTFGL